MISNLAPCRLLALNPIIFTLSSSFQLQACSPTLEYASANTSNSSPSNSNPSETIHPKPVQPLGLNPNSLAPGHILQHPLQILLGIKQTARSTPPPPASQHTYPPPTSPPTSPPSPEFPPPFSYPPPAPNPPRRHIPWLLHRKRPHPARAPQSRASSKHS